MARLSVSQVRAIMETVGELESLAAKLAARRVDDALRQQLDEALQRCQDAAVQGELDRLVALNRRIHDQDCVNLNPATNVMNHPNWSNPAMNITSPASVGIISGVGGVSDSDQPGVRKLRAGMMPPAGSPRPDRESYAAMRGWFEKELDRIAAASPNPGRKESFHRLNRVEYHNAVRDLQIGRAHV